MSELCFGNYREISATHPITDTDFFREHRTELNWKVIRERDDLYKSIEFIKEFKDLLDVNLFSRNLGKNIDAINPEELRIIADIMNWRIFSNYIKNIELYLGFKEFIPYEYLSMFKLPEEVVKEDYLNLNWNFCHRENFKYLDIRMLEKLLRKFGIIPFFRHEIMREELIVRYFQELTPNKSDALEEFIVLLKVIKKISEVSVLSILGSFRDSHANISTSKILKAIALNGNLLEEFKKWHALKLFLTI